MTVSRNLKVRTTKAELAALKAENHRKILEAPFHISGEDFTTADVANYLKICHGIAHGYLTELSDAGKIARRQKNKQTVTYSKKPSALLRMAWRKRSDGQLGIKP
jgi:hypothetical protein